MKTFKQYIAETQDLNEARFDDILKFEKDDPKERKRVIDEVAGILNNFYDKVERVQNSMEEHISDLIHEAESSLRFTTDSSFENGGITSPELKKAVRVKKRMKSFEQQQKYIQSRIFEIFG